jgi:hypothetical protein
MTRSTTRGGVLGRRAAGALALLLGIGAAGCQDFLATEPRGELTSASFFQTADQAVEATNATYSMLRGWQVHVFSWIGMTDIVSDDATKGSTPADASFLLDLDNLNFDPGNIAFRDTWTGYYQGIYRANVAIRNIPDVQMDEGLKARLVAENKFLRAYYYFFLVRAFGGVPLITEPLRPGEFTQPRATAEAVYALIVQDLMDAIAVLPEKSGYAAEDLGRATKGAARALLAEVYLFQKDYADAYTYAKQVIDSGEYSLYPTYTTLFTPAGENSSESVFEVLNTTLAEGGGSSQYAQVQGVRGTPNIGWGFNTPSSSLEASYEPGDPRLEATILYPWEALPDDPSRVVYFNPSMENNRYNQKVYTSPDTPRGSDNSTVNIRLIRYADVLLMAAEAAARTGKEAEAQEWLNMVRERARSGRTITLGFTPEEMASSIAQGALQLSTATPVFVRYVQEGSPAYTAGLRSFAAECGDENGACAATEGTPPVRVLNVDVVQSVNGTPVTGLQSYVNAVNAVPANSPVTLTVLRVQQSASGTTKTPMTVVLTARPLLPDVSASGDDLVEAIWHERRSELAMEQHRWFDIIREGVAEEAMAAVGKDFQPFMVNYPIPATEVQISGLGQNDGY